MLFQQSPWDHPHWILSKWQKAEGWTLGAHPVHFYSLGWGVILPALPVECVQRECWVLSSTCPTCWFPPCCVTLLPEGESWNHRRVSIGRGQSGFETGDLELSKAELGSS